MSLTDFIDRSISRFAKYYSWFALLMVLFVVINVLGRYFFDIRNDYAVDSTWQLYGMLIMFGCSYSLGKEAHIRTDLFWNNYKDRTKAIIDFVSYLLLFFPSFALITYISFNDTSAAIEMNERSSETMAQLIIWPMKIGITLGLVLLMVQALSQMIKCYRRIFINEQ
jgi:TRAP-type mannitol/chloroaromatic compound transport system permease small subunit